MIISGAQFCAILAVTLTLYRLGPDSPLLAQRAGLFYCQKDYTI